MVLTEVSGSAEPVSYTPAPPLSNSAKIPYQCEKYELVHKRWDSNLKSEQLYVTTS